MSNWTVEQAQKQNDTTCGHHRHQFLVNQADEPFGAFFTPWAPILRSHFCQSAVDCLEDTEVHIELRLTQFCTVDVALNFRSFRLEKIRQKCFLVLLLIFIQAVTAINSNFTSHPMEVIENRHESSHQNWKSEELLLYPPQVSDGNSALVAKVNIANVHSLVSWKPCKNTHAECLMVKILPFFKVIFSERQWRSSLYLQVHSFVFGFHFIP